MAGLVSAIHGLRVDPAEVVDASLRWHDGDQLAWRGQCAQEFGFNGRSHKCLAFYRNGGSSKLRSLRECSAPRSPRSRSSAAMPIRRCSPTAR